MARTIPDAPRQTPPTPGRRPSLMPEDAEALFSSPGFNTEWQPEEDHDSRLFLPNGARPNPTFNNPYFRRNPDPGAVVGAILDPLGLFGGGGIMGLAGGDGKGPDQRPPEQIDAEHAAYMAKAARLAQAGDPDAAQAIVGLQQARQQEGKAPIPVEAIQAQLPTVDAKIAAAGGPQALVTQAVGQALGAPALSPLASLLGAGIGGTQLGTGPLPGGFGDVASMILGGPSLPPLDMATSLAQSRGMLREFDKLRDATEKAGESWFQRITGATKPALDDIKAMLETGQNQITATAEHRNLMSQHQFRAFVMRHLRAILARLGTPLAGDYQPTQIYTATPAASGTVQYKRY